MYIKIKSVLFCLDCASDLSSFWKTATLEVDRRGIGEFSLVKIKVAKFTWTSSGTG